MDIGGALQHSALGKVDLKIAVQPQRTGQKITRRDIENIVRAAVVDGALQIVGVQQLAVTAVMSIRCFSCPNCSVAEPTQ